MTVTIVPTVNLTSSPPSVSLSITDTTGANTSVTIQRNVAGSGSATVRTSDGGPLPLTTSGSTKVGTLVDNEMPYGTLVSYVAVGGLGPISSQVIVSVTQPWLVHPTRPGLSMAVKFRPGTLQDETLSATRGVFKVLGRSNPVVITDGTRSISSSLTVSLETASDIPRLRSLISDASPLLLNLPPSLGADFPTCYVSIGDVKLSRWTDVVIDDNRDVTLPFTVVDAPVSGSGSVSGGGGGTTTRTWADLSVERVTWANAKTAYSTWTKAEAGTPG